MCVGGLGSLLAEESGGGGLNRGRGETLFRDAKGVYRQQPLVVAFAGG